LRCNISMFAVLLIVLMMSGSTLARPLEAPLGTGFTYQGKLTDGGVPANGAYDFEFKLYDALSSGSQVGGTVPKGDVIVTGGLFTVQLDFGNVFDGTAIFLDIGVRAGASTGAYTALTPRQALTATPFANYASKAPWSGLTGVPAGFADGTDNNTLYHAGSGLALVGNEFSVTGAPWSGLTGVPAGFSDGVDNDTTYTAGDGLELVGTQFKGKGTSTQNMVIVAKSGGDYTTVTAALASITTASNTNRFLIYVAPGVYNESVTMKEYVDIEGAGELTTKITSSGNTLVGANYAELRFLTVESTGGSTYAIAILNDATSPTLTHITAHASGGTHNWGVLNRNNSGPTMRNVTAIAYGGTNSYGVQNLSSASILMTDVTTRAAGGTNNYGVDNDTTMDVTMTNVTTSAYSGTKCYGVYNSFSDNLTMTNVNITAQSCTTSNYGVVNEGCSPTMTNVIIDAGNGTYNYGVFNYSSYPRMTNVTVDAYGGTISFGVHNDQSGPWIYNSVILAYYGTDSYGIFNTATSGNIMVLVNNSAILGETNSIRNDAEFGTHVGASKLSGGAVSAGGGTVTCAGVYDENYAFYASACP